jgi:hypothetical protein
MESNTWTYIVGIYKSEPEIFLGFVIFSPKKAHHSTW